MGKYNQRVICNNIWRESVNLRAVSDIRKHDEFFDNIKICICSPKFNRLPWVLVPPSNQNRTLTRENNFFYKKDKISKNSFKLDIKIMVSRSAVQRSSANLHFWEQLFGKGAFRVADELEEYICCAGSKSWLQNYLNQLICYCRCVVITLQWKFTGLIIGWAEKRHHFIKIMWMTTIDGS